MKGRLKGRRQRPGDGPGGGIWVEGRQPVREALRAGVELRLIEVAVGARGGIIDEIVALARDRGITVDFLDRDELDRRARTRNHQGIRAAAPGFSPVGVEEILGRAAERGEPPFLLVAAGIGDPQNLGSLLRTAEAAGLHGAVVPRRRSAGLTATVVRASAGAALHLPVAEVTNLSRTLKELREHGVWFAAADPEGTQTLYQCDLTGPLGVVVGSEGRGIPRLVLDHCDFRLRIPMAGRVGSLNAAVAGAVLIYEAVRQRSGSRC